MGYVEITAVLCGAGAGFVDNTHHWESYTRLDVTS